MAGSKIEWTGETWNPIVGCSILSPGCKRCYAMSLAARLALMGNAPHYEGLTEPSKAGPVWTGKVALAPDSILTKPLSWRKPRRIFVNSMGDLFHESVPDEWIDRVFAVMALAPQHTFQVLTKRSARMRAYFAHDEGFGRWGHIEHHARRLLRSARGFSEEGVSGRTLAHFGGRNLPNVWLGVSAEDQRRYDDRKADLEATPAAVRFYSIEPMLGPIDLRLHRVSGDAIDPLCDECGERHEGSCEPNPDWIIVGGESGPGARPMHPDWARSIRDQCATAGVPFFFKQWGEWEPCTHDRGHFESHIGRAGAQWVHIDGLVNGPSWHRTDQRVDTDPFAMIKVGKARAGRLLDGVTHDATPEATHA